MMKHLVSLVAGGNREKGAEAYYMCQQGGGKTEHRQILQIFLREILYLEFLCKMFSFIY